MPNEKYRAMVLRVTKYGEHDKMLTLFTLENGKMSAVAKGAQSAGSKFIASAQLFTLSEFILSAKLKLPYVSSADVIKSFTKLNKDVATLCAASYTAQLTEVIFEEDSPDEMAFRLLYYTFSLLDSAPPDYAICIATAFALKLMGINGTCPVLDKCAQCASGADKYFFDYASGGIVCTECCEDPALPIITKGEAAYLYDLLYMDINKLTQIELVEKNIQKYLFRLVNNYVVYTIGKNIKSFDMLYSL